MVEGALQAVSAAWHALSRSFTSMLRLPERPGKKALNGKCL